MTMITDARGNAFSMTGNLQRIVSLVPSTTETIYDLGLQDRLVGITRYCVHPRQAMEEKTVVGGTKDINLEKVLECRPDIILGNQEENSPEIFSQLQAEGLPCYIAFPNSVDEAMADLNNMGRLFQHPSRAAEWHRRIKRSRGLCSNHAFRYAYLIWRKPWMAVSSDTFIAHMLKEIGGTCVFDAHSERYLHCTLDDIKEQDPDVVLLSSEPYPFQEKHRQELVEQGINPAKIRFVDGEMCSWHGTRMAKAFAYLQEQRDIWG
jgi:iron complex transport system substrate-binding protein